MLGFEEYCTYCTSAEKHLSTGKVFSGRLENFRQNHVNILCHISYIYQILCTTKKQWKMTMQHNNLEAISCYIQQDSCRRQKTQWPDVQSAKVITQYYKNSEKETFLAMVKIFFRFICRACPQRQTIKAWKSIVERWCRNHRWFLLHPEIMFRILKPQHNNMIG